MSKSGLRSIGPGGSDGSEVTPAQDGFFCPVPGCDAKPPAAIKTADGQERWFKRHVTLSHSVADIPAVVDATQEGNTEQEQEAEPRPDTEAQEAPQQAPQPKQQVKVENRAPNINQSGGSKSKSIAPVLPIDPKKERIDARTKEWAGYIINDFNPTLVTYTAKWAEIPEPWLKGGPGGGQPVTLTTPDGKELVFWDPTLENQLSFSEKEAKKLARAGAMLAESQMGQVLTAWLEHNAHYIAIGGALLVAAQYGWRLMKIKGEVAQLKEIINQQMAAQGQAQPPAAEAPAA